MLLISLQDMIFKCVEACDLDLRPVLYKNIFLGGGMAMVPNMAERLVKELNFFLPPTIEPKISIVAKNPAHSAWIGGSKLAVNDKFPEIAFKSSEYETREAISIRDVIYPTIEKTISQIP